MVISSTSATEVSIQAVSPELGVHFSSTASLGSVFAAQAGGAASAVGAAAATGWGPAAGAADCAAANVSGSSTASAASGNTRLGKAMTERTIIRTTYSQDQRPIAVAMAPRCG